MGGNGSAWVKVAWAEMKMVPVHEIGAIDQVGGYDGPTTLKYMLSWI